MALWDEQDEPVLHWVLTLPPTFEQSETIDLELANPRAFPGILGVSTAQVHESLVRLLGEGFVAGRISELPRRAQWWDLRATAQGLQLLDEWPDVDNFISAMGLDLILRAIASAVPEEETKRVLEEGATAIGRLGTDVVKGTWTSVAQSAGKEIAGG